MTLTSQGDENAVGGTITYDPTVLCNPQLTLGSDDASGMLALNTTQPGQIDFAVALPPGKPLPPAPGRSPCSPSRW